MPNTSVESAEVVELIGSLWLNEVTEDSLTSMQSEEFRLPFVELGGFIPDSKPDEITERLAIEYCQLLIGPKGHISPVQSVWATNQFQSETSASMNRFFELLPSYQPASNLSDHIGVQLDFLSALLRQPEESVNEIIPLYVNQHLRWTQSFLDRMIDQDTSKFYQGLACVTKKLIESIV